MQNITVDQVWTRGTSHRERGAESEGDWLAGHLDPDGERVVPNLLSLEALRVRDGAGNGHGDGGAACVACGGDADASDGGIVAGDAGAVCAGAVCPDEAGLAGIACHAGGEGRGDL
jgi:hypothetical protein